MSARVAAAAAPVHPAPARGKSAAAFQGAILRLVKGGPERRAIDAGEIDAVVDTTTGRALLLPAAQQAVLHDKAHAISLLAMASDWSWRQDEQHRFTTITGLSERSDAADLATFIGHALWDLPLENLSEADWLTHHTQRDWRVGFRALELRGSDARGQVHGISFSGEPEFDANDRFVGYYGVALDITGRMQAQAAATRLQHQALAALDAIPTQVCVLDANGTVVLANQAWRACERTSGIAAGVPEGANFLAWCDRAAGPERADGAAVAAGIRQVMAAGAGACFEHRVATADVQGPRVFSLQLTACHADGEACTVVSRTGDPPPSAPPR